KELIAAVLARKYRTFATRGNLNNHIGVPLTLLALPPGVEVAVVEMGANAPREIAALCEIARPTHGLITNVGRDHLEGFGSVAGVARANGEMFDFLARTGGTAFVNTREPYLAGLAAAVPRVVRYPDDDYVVESLPSDFFLRLRTAGGEVETQMFGDYNFANLATALCVGEHFGVADADARAAVAAYQPADNRSQLVRRGSNVVLLDAYNANPSSMEAALRSFARLPAERKVVVLGDMLEMGAESETEHRALGELLRDLRFDLVLLCGEETHHTHAAAPGSHHFTDRAALLAWLEAHPPQGAHVLLKGSRGLGLERVVEAIPGSSIA
ncbi:MAG: UDP-N-acetylmuramoyl-tripeptide--D-alanyl-D-alanine ligase, partial [Catalinimonas sp.]